MEYFELLTGLALGRVIKKMVRIQLLLKKIENVNEMCLCLAVSHESDADYVQNLIHVRSDSDAESYVCLCRTESKTMGKIIVQNVTCMIFVFILFWKDSAK